MALKCCICKKEIEPLLHKGKVVWTQGNNANPVKRGRCCDWCDNKIVLPRRIIDMVMLDRIEEVKK